jgi:7-alpha-hydroxysteroid dehydrogenase
MPAADRLQDRSSVNPNQFSLAGRVALITGSSRGIGAAIARAFTDAGASVAVVARTTSDVESVAAELTSAGGNAVAFTADVTDLDQLLMLVERTVQEFGGLDVP